MKRIQCEEGTFVIDGNQVRYELPVSKVSIHRYEEYSEAVPDTDCAVPFTFESDMQEGVFRIYFEIDPGYMPLETFRLSDAVPEIISQLIFLGQYFERQEEVYTFYQPMNLMIGPASDVKVLFRGVHGLFPARKTTSILESIKQLIFYLLSDDLTFGEIQRWGKEAGTKLHPAYAHIGKKIAKASTWSNLESIDYTKRIATVEQGKPTKKWNIIPVRQKKVLPVVSTGSSKKKKMAIQPKWIAIVFGVLALLTPFLLPEQKVNHADPVPKQQPNLLQTGIRLAATGKYDEAEKLFNQLDFSTLSPADKKVVLYTYVNTNQFQKAIDLDSTYAETIIQYLEEKDRLNEVLSIKSNSVMIQFEQAVYKKKHKTVLQLYNQVPVNVRRGKAVVRAFISEGRSQDAVMFAKETNQEKIIEYAKMKTGLQ